MCDVFFLLSSVVVVVAVVVFHYNSICETTEQWIRKYFEQHRNTEGSHRFTLTWHRPSICSCTCFLQFNLAAAVVIACYFFCCRFCSLRLHPYIQHRGQARGHIYRVGFTNPPELYRLLELSEEAPERHENDGCQDRLSRARTTCSLITTCNHYRARGGAVVTSLPSNPVQFPTVAEG